MPTHCEYCKGKGRYPTDIWSDTAAVWEPCVLCCENDYKKFYELDNDEERIAWFRNKE